MSGTSSLEQKREGGRPSIKGVRKKTMTRGDKQAWGVIKFTSKTSDQREKEREDLLNLSARPRRKKGERSWGEDRKRRASRGAARWSESTYWIGLKKKERRGRSGAVKALSAKQGWKGRCQELSRAECWGNTGLFRAQKDLKREEKRAYLHLPGSIFAFKKKNFPGYFRIRRTVPKA